MAQKCTASQASLTARCTFASRTQSTGGEPEGPARLQSRYGVVLGAWLDVSVVGGGVCLCEPVAGGVLDAPLVDVLLDDMVPGCAPVEALFACELGWLSGFDCAPL